MNEFEFPDPPRHAIDLVAASKRRGAAVVPARGILQLAEPQISRLTDRPDWLDEDSKSFIDAQRSQSSFHVVCLTCDFTPNTVERVDEAWITVSLTRADGASPPPLGRSMAPTRLPSSRKTTRSLKLSAKLYFIEVEASEEKELSQEVLSVVGHPTPESAPSWRIKDLPEHPLDGPEVLKLVIQVPAGAECIGLVQVQTTVRRHQFLLPDRFVGDLSRTKLGTFTLR